MTSSTSSLPATAALIGEPSNVLWVQRPRDVRSKLCTRESQSYRSIKHAVGSRATEQSNDRLLCRFSPRHLQISNAAHFQTFWKTGPAQVMTSSISIVSACQHKDTHGDRHTAISACACEEGKKEGRKEGKKEGRKENERLRESGERGKVDCGF